MLLATAACDGAGKKSWAGESKRSGDQDATLKVATVKLEAAYIDRHYRTSGTLQAIRSADIVATQLAVIRSIPVDEGDTVKTGQMIARLDGRDLSLQAASAKLQLENQRRELQRLESIARGAVSAEEVDRQRYAVEEAKVSAKLSRHQAKQTVVHAPFGGTVVERYVDEGNLATTATPLVRIADLSTLELELHLPEREAATVKVGTAVDIELVDRTAFSAKVARRAPVVDALTGTVKFTIRSSDYPAGAMPGAFVRASVLVDERKDAPSIAKSALFDVEGKPQVYVVADGKAMRREVQTGLEGSTRIEVLSGLSPSDVVIRDGKAGITEGMPVVAVEADSEPADEES